MEKSGYLIREYKEEDLGGILELWEKHSSWGRPGEDEFKKWMKSPFGDCFIIVAQDAAGGIAGQMIYTPTEVVIDGSRYKALKVSAPIISGNLRTGNLLDPDSLILTLIVKGYEIIKEKGYDWLYSFPAYGWIRLIRNLHHFGLNQWQAVTYPCLEVVGRNSGVSRFTLIPVKEITDDFTRIWQQFRTDHPRLSFFSRSTEWLTYKWGDDLKIIFYEKQENPCGYAVIKVASGLLEDLVMKDFNMIPDALSELAGFWADFGQKSGAQSLTLRVMENGVIRKYTSNMLTRSVDFTFCFAISSFMSYDASQFIETDRWYVFPND